MWNSVYCILMEFPDSFFLEMKMIQNQVKTMGHLLIHLSILYHCQNQALHHYLQYYCLRINIEKILILIF